MNSNDDVMAPKKEIGWALRKKKIGILSIGVKSTKGNPVVLQ